MLFTAACEVVFCVTTTFQVRKGDPESLGGRVVGCKEHDQYGQKIEDHEGEVGKE